VLPDITEEQSRRFEKESCESAAVLDVSQFDDLAGDGTGQVDTLAVTETC
jgi:hypothetical protein